MAQSKIDHFDLSKFNVYVGGPSQDNNRRTQDSWMSRLNQEADSLKLKLH